MVGEGVLFAATLALAEPLTTLARSARSCVSLVARCNGGYEDTLTPLHRFVTAAARSVAVPAVVPLFVGRAERCSARYTRVARWFNRGERGGEEIPHPV